MFYLFAHSMFDLVLIVSQVLNLITSRYMKHICLPGGSFWCLMYIAMEIDQPFGADANDLPIKANRIFDLEYGHLF